jgi:orotidine-5'-phosphate decarboxylase
VSGGARTDPAIAAAIEVPERTRRATYAQRLARRAKDAPLAACVGIDPSPPSLALLDGVAIGAPGREGRSTRAAAMERFSGLLVESARDHAAAVKLQAAWFETAGAPGIRALERTIEFARTAGLLVVLDAKRGDVPHSALAYASAWLGDGADAGPGVDALTVNAAVGIDAVEAMALVAVERHAALYALVHTSNPGADELQAAPLADGRPWWRLLADSLAQLDRSVGPGVVGAVVGATRPGVPAQVREAMPTAPLLVPGLGAQGGSADELDALRRPGDAPATLVPASRSLLPATPGSTQAFRHHVSGAAARLAAVLGGRDGDL